VRVHLKCDVGAEAVRAREDWRIISLSLLSSCGPVHLRYHSLNDRGSLLKRKCEQIQLILASAPRIYAHFPHRMPPSTWTRRPSASCRSHTCLLSARIPPWLASLAPRIQVHARARVCPCRRSARTPCPLWPCCWLVPFAPTNAASTMCCGPRADGNAVRRCDAAERGAFPFFPIRLYIPRLSTGGAPAWGGEQPRGRREGRRGGEGK